jgi:cyclophilin family peptidyl-prolyl cis-trans isomerase
MFKQVRYFLIGGVVAIMMASCAKPMAIFSVEKQSSHAPSTVKFNNASTKANTYLWDFGDGKTSTDVAPEHRYTLSGKYKVTLKAIKDKKTNMSTQEVILDPPHDCLIEMQTTQGTMIIKLYDETPLHRDNFIKLAEEGYYDGMLFHRVIKGFMIQGGDPDSKNAPAGKRLGIGGPGYTVPAEFVDTLVHIKGALAAARQGDAGNPKKASSGSQFYIVQGKPVAANQLSMMEAQKGIKYTAEAQEILTTQGGTPFLDKEYTVFGRVVKGLDVIDAVTDLSCDGADRPTTDAKILSVKVIK